MDDADGLSGMVGSRHSTLPGPARLARRADGPPTQSDGTSGVEADTGAPSSTRTPPSLLAATGDSATELEHPTSLSRTSCVNVWTTSPPLRKRDVEHRGNDEQDRDAGQTLRTLMVSPRRRQHPVGQFALLGFELVIGQKAGVPEAPTACSQSPVAPHRPRLCPMCRMEEVAARVADLPSRRLPVDRAPPAWRIRQPFRQLRFPLVLLHAGQCTEA
jgi:hypothetical protein